MKEDTDFQPKHTAPSSGDQTNPTSVSVRFKRQLCSLLPIIQWLPSYTKFNLISDLVAGITVGLTMIPQSLAYASLADVSPQYGLYTAFIGSFVYIFFGTIKEVSIGPTSLMAILVYSYTHDKPVELVVLLSFLSGCTVLAMGFFRLGFLVDFISAPVISGFTSATSIIIVVGQLKGVLGLKVKSNGSLDLLQKYFAHLSDVQLHDAVIGFSCIVFLTTIKFIGTTKTNILRLKKALWLLSISRNALTVLITTAITFYLIQINGKVSYKLSGDVPSGLPTVKLPPFSTTIDNRTLNFVDMLHELGSGIVVTPIVAVLANVAIAKAFAAGVVVDATQEMLALGMCNIFGAFVQAMPATGAFTRSAVAHASGVRTPLQGIYSGSIILLALSFLTPYFCYIPRATLSSVLICAVISLVDYEIVPKLMRYNKFELSLTITTFCVCVAFGVEIGLLIGVVMNLLCTLKMWTRPEIETKIITDKSGDQILYIRPELGLMYPAVDYLTEKIVKEAIKTDKSNPIALDFEKILALDYTACQTLNNLIKVFKQQGRPPVIFQNVSEKIFKLLEKAVNIKGVHIYRCEQDYSRSELPESEEPLLEVKTSKK